MPTTFLVASPAGAPTRSPQARTPCGTATLVNGVWVFADDTPSRHPCKESVSRNSKKRRFIFNPYRAQVVLGDNLEPKKGGSDKVQPNPAKPSAAGGLLAPTAIANPEGNNNHGANHGEEEDDDDDGVVETAFDNVLATENANQPKQRHVTLPQTTITVSTETPASKPAEFHALEHRHAPQQTRRTTPPPKQQEAPPSSQIPEHVAAANTERGPMQSKAFLVRFKFSESLFAAREITSTRPDGTPEGSDSEGEPPAREKKGNEKANHEEGGDHFSHSAANPPQQQQQRKKNNAPFEVGDLVVVEGDRGENIGVISEIGNCDDMDRLVQLPLILRHSMNKDRKRYYHARRKDAVASRSAQQYARDLGLPMNILDAEFQVDLQKLTIYYRCYQPATKQVQQQPANGELDGHVDFRQLQRSLYKLFRCRIWLVNWDSDPRLQDMVKMQVQPASQQPHTVPQRAGPVSQEVPAFHAVVGGNPHANNERTRFTVLPQSGHGYVPQTQQRSQHAHDTRRAPGNSSASFTVVGHTQQQHRPFYVDPGAPSMAPAYFSVLDKRF